MPHPAPDDATLLAGRPLRQWRRSHPLLDDLIALRPTCWFNPALAPAAQALGDVGLTRAEVDAAAARFDRFAPWIARRFADTAASGGCIESPLRAVPALHAALRRHWGLELPGALLLKLDSALPISGSIKARGGIHEVLAHAEALALASGRLRADADYAQLDSDAWRAFFGRYRIAVGSTGNLGLSIGIVGVTAADGLAVGRPSGFVGRAMQRLIDGYCTVDDDALFALLGLAARTEDLALEPSALAGLAALAHLAAPAHAAARARLGLTPQRLAAAHHIAWMTGGGLVPPAQRRADLRRARAVLAEAG